MKFGALFTAGLALTGCASNLAQMQTARALKPGELRMSGGVGWYVPVTQLGSVAGTGVQIAKQGIEAAINQEEFQLSDANKRRLAINSVALQAMPPSPSVQIDARLGVLPRLDVGLRYSIDAVRADVKLNFWHDGEDDPEDGHPRRSKDLALGFALSKSLLNRAISDPNGLVKIDGFSRWDFEVPLYASIDVSRYFGVYGAGRYRFSTIRFDQHVTTVSDCGCSEVPTRTTTVTASQMVSHFYGATVGIRVGNHRFTWMLELTLGQTNARTRLLDLDVELGGFTLYPATGIALTF
jgi:hypothetical protein